MEGVCHGIQEARANMNSSGKLHAHSVRILVALVSCMLGLMGVVVSLGASVACFRHCCEARCRDSC